MGETIPGPEAIPAHWRTMHDHTRLDAEVGDVVRFDDPLDHERTRVHGCPAWAVVTHKGETYIGGRYIPQTEAAHYGLGDDESR